MADDATYREEALLFGRHARLAGILTRPILTRPTLARDNAPAFVLLTAGLAPRIGPQRLYVRIARELAARGFVTLRYDASITGDSRLASGALAAQSLAELRTEPKEALDELERLGVAQRFVLLGLCSGAASALCVAAADPRVVGAVLVGLPPPRGPHRTAVLARHFLRIAFASSFRRRKLSALLRFDFDLRRIAATFAALALAPFRARGAAGAADADPLASPAGLRATVAALTARKSALLIVHAEGDEGLDWTRAQLSPGSAHGVVAANQFVVIRGANHLFTLRSAQERLLDAIRGFALRLDPGR